LHVTGRDVEERELALRFDAALGTWALLGDAQEWAMSDTRRRIVEALRESPAMRPKEIADAIGADHAVVKHLVRRMVNARQLTTDGKGHYMYPVHSVHSVHPQPEYEGGARGEQSERVDDRHREALDRRSDDRQDAQGSFGALAVCGGCGSASFYRAPSGRVLCPGCKGEGAS
jgi:hypothetical protein